uniref:Cytochrome b n=2 Tax=Hirudiniformes TaxID=6416 RepID=X2CBS2_HIRNI|nr:cytochrome b [Whitmania pigra]YP_009019393.1 cytochrome b [Hirudo nipponia]ABX79783.1 cytochrome b [Whitmania pigra]AGL10933.1 cytochrome b [Hirudo nipponia]
MMMQLRKSHPVMKVLNGAMVDLPAPLNISIWWNYGSLLGLMLIIQLITGLLLSMHYCSNVELAFSSVVHIMRNVDFGWMLRYTHANAASLFFLFMYIHIGRGIYYMSFVLIEVWNIGVVLFILTVATAFLGYVLPWGQMSFWGATVITNLLSTIPYSGTSIVEWVWGGFSISNPTLTRFFSIHFVLPFVMVAFVIIHLLFLHQTGSNNPLGVVSDSDRITFHPYYLIKDLLGFLLAFLLLLMLVFFMPNLFSDSENFMPANPSMTPTHIKPEWYFLWIYAILRSIPNKLGGVIAAFSGILIMFVLPLYNFSQIKSLMFYPLNSLLFFYLLFFPFIILTWIGGCPVKDLYINVGQVCTVMYFSYFLFTPFLFKMFDVLMVKD